MSPYKNQNESNKSLQTKEHRIKKVRSQKKRTTRKLVRSASHWEWMYQRPSLNYEERLLVWLRGFEGLPWKDICTRYNTEMGINARIERLQMKLNRLDKKLMKKSIEEELKSQKNNHPSFIQELVQNNCNLNDFFLEKVDPPPRPPRTPSPPPPPPPPRGYTLFANNQQLLSVDQYCFDTFDIASSNLFPEAIMPTNYFNTDQLHLSQVLDFGNEQIHSALFP